MNDRIHRLLSQITALEDELRAALHEQETRIHFRIVGKHVEFQKSIRDLHRQLKMALRPWLATSELRGPMPATGSFWTLVTPIITRGSLDYARSWRPNASKTEEICAKLRIGGSSSAALAEHGYGIMKNLDCVHFMLASPSRTRTSARAFRRGASISSCAAT
jgi:hypothetical protein